MDCGPASLKCLLEGFGIPISYGRLREACQTGIDGTSIDTMETVANQLGLRAEQILLPADHIFIPEAKALPALLVVLLPNGLTHFVVVWRRHGSLLQVMDPSVGRRWVSVRRFMNEIYPHTMPATAADWLEFARSEDFQVVLSARLKSIGIAQRDQNCLLHNAAQSWQTLAGFDAALRLVQSLGRSIDAGSLLERLLRQPEMIPDRYWSVRPAPQDAQGGDQVLMRGAVLVRVTGTQPRIAPEQLGRELSAAIGEKPAHPGRELLGALWRSGPTALLLLLSALLLAGCGTIIEAIIFRSVFDVAQELALVGQRLGAIAGVILFSLGLLLIEFPSFALGVRLGRQIENRFRVLFLEKIPKLGDRYFQSRLISDMAERSHATKRLRNLPDQVRQLLRSLFELCFTAAAVTWLEPSIGGFVWLIVVVILVAAVATQPALAERDLKVRSHAAGLTRFYLDAMLGLIAIRAHGGETSMRREHGKMLGNWADATLGLQRLAVAIESMQLLLTFGLVGALLLAHPFTGSDVGRVLLLVYWVLNLPLLGQEIGTLVRQYPYYRNLTLRLLDPLGAPEEPVPGNSGPTELVAAPGIDFRSVSLQISGHAILDDVSVHIEPGQHVGIVGPSGAGKSSLVGLLLSWVTPTVGEILIDGKPFHIEQIRASTAWVDPSVQLWNRSLLSNVTYGNDDATSVAEAIDGASLRNVLENLPEGMQTRLGEGGAVVSGGEGQRVRFARALLKNDVKLVILDEPFRGLDREKRQQLLARAHEFWRDATLLCITHDISETQHFDRVIVMERGRIAETGAPGELASDPGSRYSRLLYAERQTQTELWGDKLWRRVRVDSGRVLENLTPFERTPAPRAEVA
jgi:ABC-type bacteriocin/lantibiotic exporter with double-glycine peptidase domain